MCSIPGQEDSLEKEMATHSNILAWEIPWTEDPGSYSPWGLRVGNDLVTKQQEEARTKLSFPYIHTYTHTHTPLAVSQHLLNAYDE